MVCLTTLLDSARDAGLTWYTEGSRLIVSGPRSAGDIGKQVLGRKIEVLAMITTPAANQVTYDPIPDSVINDLLKQTTSADGSHDWKLFPLFSTRYDGTTVMRQVADEQM